MENDPTLENLVNFTFEKFQTRVGSQQMATKEALRVIGKYLDNQKPKTILEIGAGIGTITSFCNSIVANSSEYFAFERDSWCRNQLNALDLSQNVKIIMDLAELDGVETLDFVIVDDLISQQELHNVLEKLSSVFTIIVEGHRYRQRQAIARYLKIKSISFKYISVGKSADSYKGAGIFFNDEETRTALQKPFILSYLFRIRLNIWFMKFRQFRAKIHLRKILGISK